MFGYCTSPARKVVLWELDDGSSEDIDEQQRNIRNFYSEDGEEDTQ